MSTFDVRRSAQWISAATLLLAGCGGSQPPIGTPGAVHQATAVKHVAKASGSSDLLYVSSSGGDVFVYSYPQGKLVQTITGFYAFAAPAVCVDSRGNVFIASITNPTSRANKIYEYAHGASQPFATLSDTGWASGCSIDPVTGDLAVANQYDESNPYNAHYGSLAIYKAASGKAKTYFTDSPYIGLCSYDGQGALYLWLANNDDVKLARFSRGHFKTVHLGVTIYGGSPSAAFTPMLQWDGQNMTISSHKALHEPVQIYRLQITGLHAKVVGTTSLETKHGRLESLSWIQGDQVLSVGSFGGPGVGVWAYPGGGQPTQEIKHISKISTTGSLKGIAISVGSDGF